MFYLYLIIGVFAVIILALIVILWAGAKEETKAMEDPDRRNNTFQD